MLRVPRRPHGQCLDAQRLPAGRKREDVEEPRQLHHHPGVAGGLAGRSAAPQHAEDALSLADRLDLEGTGRKREDARRLVCGRSRRQGRAAGRCRDRGDCPTTSTRRRRSRRCTVCATLRLPAANASASEFAASLRLLGFLSESAEAWKSRKQQASGVDAAQVDRLIADRAAARARKDFKESDRIRDELAAMGVASRTARMPKENP